MTIEVPLTDPGERLIWSGNPIPARYALRKASYRFLFGIFFFGFSLFWINGAYTAWQYFRGMQTTYALTDRRAIMNISGPFPRRISVPLNQVPFVEVLSSAEGPGHVLFQEPVASYSNRGMAQRDGFIAIADAAQIGQILRGAIEKSAGARVSGLRQ
jgi:hypothetical protein